jgi:FkbH-like protein
MTKSIYTFLEWLPKPPENFAARCESVLEQAENAGLELQSLATRSLDQNQLIRLAKTIEKIRAKGTTLEPLTAFRLGILSNSTTDFIVPALIATAARHGIALEVVVGGYDQALQDALDTESRVNRAKPDAVLLAIDHRKLQLHGIGRSAEEGQAAAGKALEYLGTVREAIKRNSQAVCILQTISAPPETLFGSMDAVYPGTARRIIDAVNSGIAHSIEGSTDVLVDVAHLAATVGLSEWHSPSEWNMAKTPFSDAYLPLYADHVCRVIAALRGKSRRCLVLDLDNTLWGGVVGDDGLEGIQLAQGDAIGEAYLNVQRLAMDLRARGIVLAVCSKNEDEIARSPFRNHPDMLVREDHIAVFQANWMDKATNLKAIADELSLGLESLVFLDDNPVERFQVRQALPQVAVPELPSDAALYSRTLAAAGYFESVALSEDDLRRADFYRDNARRANLQKKAVDLESYLASLEMEITFQSFDETGRPRITQLINKSNQFNLTTKRYTEAQVAAMQNDPAYFTLQVRLADVFGDNGMISVVICRRSSEEVWEIDSWIMSCRVLGRRVENMVLREILEEAKKQGIRKLTGVYARTDRNGVVVEHYPKLGFKLVKTVNQVSSFELEVEGAFVEGAPMKLKYRGWGQPEKSREATKYLPRHASAEHAPIEGQQERRNTPVNEVEAELVRMWEEILDRKSIGVQDNFFDLGGDSILAVRLMIDLEKKYQRRFEVSKLASHGTIEALARQLGAPNTAEEAALHLVPMRPEGARTPLFCVHCGTGHVLRYRALTSFLDPESPIYGLRAPNLLEMGGMPTVEGLAQLYLDDVRKVQPHGPYQFLGFCFGGSVAFEIARRLSEQGEPVALVALVETVNASNYRELSVAESLRHRALRQYDRVHKYGSKLLRGNWKEIYSDLRDSISWNRRKLQWRALTSRWPETQLSGSDNVQDTISLLSIVGEAFNPKPYPGKICLIRAEQQVAAMKKDSTFGWQAIARGGVEVHTVMGDHFTILEKPYVSGIADVLNQWLTKSADRRATTSSVTSPLS